MTTKTNILLFILITLLIQSGSVFGQIYKWVDADGKTHFSSSPPQQGKVETVQPKINTYTSPDLPASDNTTAKPINKIKKKVVMYSAIWCGVCKKAKSYFRANKIQFTEYDIDTSAKGKRDYKRLKRSGVPIILVGKQRMDGFSAARFQSMYGG
jgi:glutaredoxin